MSGCGDESRRDEDRGARTLRTLKIEDRRTRRVRLRAADDRLPRRRRPLIVGPRAALREREAKKPGESVDPEAHRETPGLRILRHSRLVAASVGAHGVMVAGRLDDVWVQRFLIRHL